MSTSRSHKTERAAALGSVVPLSRLHPAAVAELSRRPRKDALWAVALSGGADSVALLLLLWTHFPVHRKKIVALHFNHRLRGRASAADERFCRSICRDFGIRYYSGTWDARQRGATEAAAREARFEFLVRICTQLGCRVVCLGHNLNDVAESLLMRVARGSGTSGLAAPRPVQRMPGNRIHVRPLLTLPHSAIEEALRLSRFSWREDGSNASAKFFRNRIRRFVLPAWLSAAGDRDALACAGLTRSRLEEDDDALESWATESRALRGRVLDLTRLDHVPVAVSRRLLHRWLGKVAPGLGLARQAFDVLLTAVVARKRHRQSLGATGFALVTPESLRFAR